ncbi:YopX family protein [Lactiplantibacillus argentoratensis]|uniref:YopX family protein n=1 Tax=Lactiplantibacillus argentoratensis TaxID=271881 RepID=UPI0030CD4F9B
MIKFRAWEDRGKEYIKDVLIGSDGKIYFDDGVATQDDLDISVEQFTGLKDVNSKDIYEGDILQPVISYTKRNIGKPFEVNKGNYVYGKWIAKDVSSKEFDVDGCYFSNEIKAIGNVHMDGDLIDS